MKIPAHPRRALRALRRLRDASVDGMTSWNRRMLDEADDDTRRGTRWGRGALALVPTALAVGALGAAISQGALAASFNVTDKPFTLTSNGIDGLGFGAIVNTPSVGHGDGSTSTDVGMTRMGFASADLAGLCGIVHQSVAGVPYSLLLTAGQEVTAEPPAQFTTDIDASNLFLQATDIKSAGTTTLENAVIGQSADQVLVDGRPLTGAVPGAFGLGSTGENGGSSIKLYGLDATAYDAEIAGSLVLPQLTLRVVAGTATSC
ncbi:MULTISPECIES: DUF6230 family protein [unclassified Streptomyces]|uniref:DUF6230 family protein n=1 Tax=unclassified Streptomyces TaxID=2593676 RepID=UPI0022B7332C|nr:MULTISPECIES: DUF6230 family protein [unclassified Streptomyces]MCZ7417704.1 DUF6230 family protein [Streptomyces sp. WMMC897]MCZ7432500.1 DUF6230 family protein [Streptomyces sp. WMMC1477]